MPASLRLVLLAALAVSAGCGRTTYRTEGDLLAVDAGGATIAHDAIPGAGGAATRRFPARPPSVLDAARPGMRVSIELERDGDELVLVGLAPAGRPGAVPDHDHSSRHGGVVDKARGVHVEVAASPDGRVRAWLSDEARRPLSVGDATGTVRVHLPGGERSLSLAPAGDALEARGAPFEAESAMAEVTIDFRGERLAVNVLLDLTGKRAGMAIVPQTPCVPVPPPAAGERAPRCAVTFPATFTAIGTTPDGSRAVVAVTHGDTSVWSLPDARLLMGLDPLPPLGAAPGVHDPDARVIAVRPDGAEIGVAAGPRIVFFDAATGRLRRKLDGPGGNIRAVAWSADGRSLLVAAGGVSLLDAVDGRVVRTIAVDGPALAVALDAGGRWAAAGTEAGAAVVADLAGGEPRTVASSSRMIAAIAFAGDRLLAAGADGSLRVLDPATGEERARVDAGASLRLLAVAGDGRYAATAGADHALRVHRLPDAAVVERLDWHRATVSVLAWGAGPTLVSGDNDAALAVWDVPAAR